MYINTFVTFSLCKHNSVEKSDTVRDDYSGSFILNKYKNELKTLKRYFLISFPISFRFCYFIPECQFYHSDLIHCLRFYHESPFQLSSLSLRMYNTVCLKTNPH